MKTDNEKYNESVLPNTAFINELKSKLPEFFNDNDQFDMDKFKASLQEHNVDELKDGYQLNFIGKDYARRQAGEMPSTVIVPDEEQNKGEGRNSGNLFFTGDNLEVLRHLQASYTDKVDVIYIDPPYNTGNDDFVYPDNFEYSDEKLKEMFGLDDEQVLRLKSIQGKSSHSAWLTFMYPRLALAKKLLSKKGIIFISIDDNEQANLREIIIDIFSEQNVIGTLPVINNLKGNQDQFAFAGAHEYILCCVKDISCSEFHGLRLSQKELSEWKEDNKGLYKKGASLKSTGVNAPREKRPNLYFPIYIIEGRKISLEKKENAKELLPITNGKEMSWRWSREKIENNIDDIIISQNGENFSLYKKQRPVEGNVPTKKPKSFLYKPEYSSGNGTAEVSKLFNSEKIFDYPKSTALIKDLLLIGGDDKSLVLDFFAGSATTADAVMQLNAKDGGHRKFIMVQLSEKTYHTNKDGKEVPTKSGETAYGAGFKSIDEISRERIRRAAAKIREEEGLMLPEDFDGSFKHYRVVKPTQQTLDGIDDFDLEGTALFTGMVEAFSSQALEVSGDTSGEDTILTTWLAKDGYPFDVDIKQVEFAGYPCSVVDDNRLYLIREGWGSENTENLLNKLGTHSLDVQTVVIFGYSFNVAELRELENGLKSLENTVSLIKRY
ncbi:site-specific DNA-methyltransferase [Ligilactobacillus ruminis]|uniref:site-specific DNA-methyltransferase n=1 Tax=Ligilactobacillus ruminis TaxID=1623 RepID=UPI00232DFC1F|nr:site-specific DNA-methyltransferase [Ligilactobacillus ruminis]MDB7642256.1 site-specific DNA-methyltransferase [Ligilactobacillus ruminis]MDB7646774.1 site-specific DNA-methyltransferase [Ligilactobacillus ruminis]MDB7648892.1 site-specific DNA-methyltransferase [Ligilactobacillus ruminis]